MEKPGTQLESFYAPRLLERRFKWQCRKIRKVCCILEKLSADCASWGTAWWCSLLGLQVCSVLASWLWRSGPIIGTSSMTIQPTTQVRATWAHILDCGGLLKVRQLNSNPLLRSVVCARCQSQGLQMKCGWAVRRFRDALSVKLLCVKKKKKSTEGRNCKLLSLSFRGSLVLDAGVYMRSNDQESDGLWCCSEARLDSFLTTRSTQREELRCGRFSHWISSFCTEEMTCQCGKELFLLVYHPSSD